MRMLTSPLLLLLLGLALAGCASQAGFAEPPPPPSVAEMGDYLRAGWRQEAPRLATYPRQAGEMPADFAASTYVALRDMTCRPYFVVVECDLVVTVRMADGRVVDGKRYAQFDRAPDGALRETMLFVEQRRR